MAAAAKGIGRCVLLCACLTACVAREGRPAASADMTPAIAAPTSEASASAAHAPTADSTSTAAEPSALHYIIRADAALSTLEVQLCFEGRSARDLMSGAPETASALRSVWIERGQAREAIAVSG